MAGERLKGSGTSPSPTRKKKTGTSMTSSCYLINGEWDSLPTVVFVILDKLLEPADHIRFAAICKHYRSLAKDYKKANQHTRQLNKDQLPPPMLWISNRKQTALVSVSEGKLYENVKFPELHPDPQTWRCYGSSHGWLASGQKYPPRCDYSTPEPVRETINYYLSSFLRRFFFSQKIMLSEDPALNPDCYVVGVLYDCSKLAFVRAREQDWTCIPLPRPHEWVDAIFYKSQIYAVGRRGQIVSVNLDSNSYNVPEAKLLRPENLFPLIDCARGYLVESSRGDLLYIERLQGKNWTRINGFKVYKVVFSDGDDSVVEQLLETTNIGDEALYVDGIHAVSASTSNFPKCQRNSIYYAHCFSKGPDGISTLVFNLEDETIIQPYPLNTMQSDTVQTFWIMPWYNI